jgi:NADH:ubiquinone oxidoreductase subunit K
MVRYAIRRKPITRGAGDKVGNGLALIIAIYRHKRTTNVNEVNELKG